MKKRIANYGMGFIVVVLLVNIVGIGCERDASTSTAATPTTVREEGWPVVRLQTMKHDNHQWVVGTTHATAGGSFLHHHPDCPCGKATTRPAVEK